MGWCESSGTSIRPRAVDGSTARFEHHARIIRGATPRFASQLSHKYAQLNAGAVQADLQQNHGRKVTRSYLQNVAEWVGSLATAKEETWEYALPRLDAPIATVVVSLDGAMIPMADSDGYREAMAGTLSFYDHDGERQHTLYLAAAPEYGKQTFYQRLEREIARAKQQFPEARYLGIADGASGNWSFLEQHTQRQLIDFFHASEYVGKIAQARYPQRNAEAKRAHWQQQHCHQLKHDPDALDALIGEAARLSRRGSLSQTVRDGAYSAWTYFNNHRHQMDYPGFLAEDSADRLRCDGGRLQDPRQATPLRLRDALEDQRCRHRAQFTRLDTDGRTLDAVLGEDRSIRG